MSDIRLAQYRGYVFIVQTAMTPTQVQIVQDSFRRIGPQASEASRFFYEELFQIAPALRESFPEDMALNQQKFVQMLAMIIKSLDHISEISDQIKELGRRHMGYDVEDDHYPLVGQALLTMLERVLGPDFTPEVKEAWGAAYEMIARVMQEASVTPTTAEGFYGTIIRSVLTSQYGVSIALDRNTVGRAPITRGIERGQVVRFS